MGLLIRKSQEPLLFDCVPDQGEDFLMALSGVHHIALICSNYQVSKAFYVGVLGFRVLSEVYREGRDSHKLDLALGDGIQLELFSFPNPPKRLSHPEAAGLRHLAFRVDDVEREVASLSQKGVCFESVRVDEHTGKKFVFFQDPDGLPLELYER